MIEPLALGYPGFSPTKGATTLTPWKAQVDVSAWPADTVWQMDGVTLTAVDGKLSITGTGTKSLGFTAVGTSLGLAEGEGKFLDVRLIVDPTSFSTPDYKNNGTGWQPGDGKPKEFNTFSDEHGSRRGIVYPNNDFSRAWINRPTPKPSVLWEKLIRTPADSTKTVFDDGNRLWSATTYDRWSDHAHYQHVAMGTQFEQQLLVLSDKISDGERTLTFQDRWDVSRQRTALGAKVKVLDASGNQMPANLYKVEWTTDATAQSGWRTEYVTTRGDYAAVRVTFVDTIPTGTEPGSPSIQWARRGTTTTRPCSSPRE